ncbi:hypothetical protein SK128_003826 [Halocaridina rubra]|uniref:Uncharacterized protein n=1 Tax=Halocaridina rubra TaxID=373956 RepID=A0AAN8XFY2_HALRR
MRLILVSSFLALLVLVKAENERDGRIVVAYSTKTAYSITTSVTTIPLTCASTGNPVVCKKRRYRRYKNIILPKSDLTGPDLDASHEEAVAGTGRDFESFMRDTDISNFDKDQDGSNRREGKIAVTVWTTRSSTFTVTSTSINSALTFSVSYFCTFNGANLAPACG